MTEEFSRFDSWIMEGGPSALILKEYLEPAGGEDQVIFPPTFAPPEEKRGEAPGYIIDGEGDGSICLIDSVGSQANRLEPIFKAAYSHLVPQIEITVKGRRVNLLDLGHRAADATIRSTSLAPELEQAFVEYASGNAVPLARLAPTSLVFGAWDSRGSQVKVPRIVDSTVRAFKVRKLSRAAQYFSALENEEVEELLGVDTQKQRKPLSKAGFLDAPSGVSHGGVQVRGDIVRTTVVNFVALRALGAPDSKQQLQVRRYILGLTLLSAFAPSDMYLRQGCILVRRLPKEDSPASEQEVVFRDGKRQPESLSPPEVEVFAKEAATQFGVGKNHEVTFDPKAAKELLKKASKEKDPGS